jgi:DNA-binding HxlR family transcriptional regulator
MSMTGKQTGKMTRRSAGRFLSRRGGRAGGSAGGDPAGGSEPGAGLNWRGVLDRVAPVRQRWDLAILCNLCQGEGRTPGQLRAAINAQCWEHAELSAQYLSGRLKVLEAGGYVWHYDQSQMPYIRHYYQLPAAEHLVTGLLAVAGLERRRAPRPARG